MATRLSTIATNIAGVSVALGGVTVAAKALTTMPDSLRAASLPMRLVLADGTVGEGGIRAVAIGGALQQAVWRIRDVFVYKPVAQGVGLEEALPVLATYVGTYAAAMSSKRTIATNSVIEDITAEIAVWEYPEGSGTKYHIVEHVLSIRETF